MATKIIGCGSYLPEKIVSNQELAANLDTSDEWIKARTGIAQRHIASDQETCSYMALKAATEAISQAEIEPSIIDLILVCTNTADYAFPSVANQLQALISPKPIASFDLQAICAGFIHGLHVADALIKAGSYQTILLVCAEKMSSLLDWQDRSTCILFGDGAGAVLLQKSNSDSGLIDSHIYSDGNMADMLYAASKRQVPYIKMNGSELFKKAVEKMSESAHLILQNNQLTIGEIDFFIPHQANLRIINLVASKLGINSEKSIVTIGEHANCSAASIPLALAKLCSTKGIKAGSLILFTAFGAGTSWGSALIRW